MTENHNIYFITWPDGRVEQESLTVVSAEYAKMGFISSYLPERFFGEKMNWLTSYVIGGIWSGMQEKGFRCHHIKMIDGKPEYVE
jgi:hypothetical protein